MDLTNYKEIKSGLFFGKLKEGDDVSNFNCGNDNTNEFLHDDALEYQKNNLAITFLLIDDSDKIIGYISLAMGGIKSDNPVVFRDLPDVDVSKIPVLKIAQLAICEEKQGRYLGKLLIDAAINIADKLKASIGCKYVNLDSYPDKVGYYENLGFETWLNDLTGRDTIPMVYLLE